jgi:hypothetical protein
LALIIIPPAYLLYAGGTIEGVLKMKKFFSLAVFLILLSAVCWAEGQQESNTNQGAEEITKLPRPLGDDAFEISQNPDNTVTISAFNLARTKPDPRNRGIMELRGIPITYDVVEIPETLYGLPVSGISAYSGFKMNILILPNTITSISGFSGCGLLDINLSSGLKSINGGAFSDNRLTSVTLPSGLTSIGKDAFANNQITSVTLPSGLTSIGESAFANNRITSVTLPSGLTSIGRYAFANNQITSVTLPSGLKSIGYGAFANNKIQSVVIPDSLSSVESGIIARVFERNPIVRITLPANIRDSALQDLGFEANFITFYAGQDRLAGTYEKNGPVWSRSRAGGID